MQFSGMAREILEMGVIKFGAFKLKLHEKNPDAPLSPVYLSFRKPPKGPLDDQSIYELGRLIWKVAEKNRLRYDGVIGIPEAGVPFATVVSRFEHVPQFYLDKTEVNGKRRVVLREGQDISGRILLVDDLVTEADTKLEAVQAVFSGKSASHSIVVLVDREQRGREVLQGAGCRLVSVWRLSELLSFYRDEGLLSKEKYEEVFVYLRSQQT